MDNKKRENLLNLALDATEEERLKSVNLNVGYAPGEKTWELIVRYNGSLESLRDEGNRWMSWQPDMRYWWCRRAG